ncbi:MAG TPA: hypothetical protein VGL70_01460 [Candidatus Binatia bacterium]
MVKTKFDLPSQLFNYKPVRLAGNLLEKVRKNGVGSVANQKNLTQNAVQSALRLQQQTSMSARFESRVHSHVDTQTVRSAQQDGQTLKTSTQQVSQGDGNQQHRREVTQHSNQVVQGQVNGKPVYKNVERDVHQVNVGNRDADFKEARVNNESTTRNVVKNGNATRVSINIASTSDRNRSDAVAAQNRTETEARVRVYDSLGNLVSDKSSRQAVTTKQEQAIDVKAHGDASRQVEQETVVAVHQEGKASLRKVSSETTDASQGHQEIETHVQSTSATLVENLGAEGEVLSAKASSQQVTTTEARTIDTRRLSQSEQTTKALSRPGETENSTRTEYEIKAATMDHVVTTGTVEQFDGNGKLVREQAIDRETTTTTSENRNGEASARTAVTKESNGDTLAETEIKSEESVALAMKVVSDNNGAKTERAIDTKVESEMKAELLNRVDADGQRAISFDAKQERRTETDDLTVNANGQGRLVESETKVAQLVQGQIEYSPDTQQVGAGLGKGAVIVDIRTAAGLRASFRLDQGTLEFDFSSVTATVSHQEIASGKVVEGQNGEATVAGATTDTQRASLDAARFQGRVVATVDAAGNRVFELDGKVVQESAAALVANEGQGLQAELSHTELDVSGRLAVNRQVSSDGGTTLVQTQAEAEMNVAKVENREAAAVGMPSLAHLTTADAVRAGFQAYRGALHLNAAGFSVSISFVA